LIFKSLTTRVIAISITLLAFGISAFTFLNLKREKIQILNSARENTDLVLQSIEASIFSSMRLGNVEDTRTVLERIGTNRKLVGVRIFHPHGIILKSSRPAEVGKPVTDTDYQLFINNRKEGFATVAGHGEVLSMVKPIYNDVACHACHGHKTRIIGVLNVQYSLEDTRRTMIEGAELFIFSTVLIIVFLSLAIAMIMLKFVKQPLLMVAESMARVAEGDLSVRMKPGGKDEMGRLISTFDTMVDRLDTAKKELDQLHFQQMERADRLASMGEMAAGIAHEVKNPLTGIAAAITIIKDDFETHDPRGEILDEVLEQIKRLDKTVNDLLFFGKPTPPELTYTDLNSVLQKTLKFAVQHRSGRGDIIEKRLVLLPDLPPVYVDPKQIQQVLLNLILNAFQAMQEGGTMTITTEVHQRDGYPWVMVSIADTGSGIPAQIRERIFTPFFTTKAQGTGLGLAICHKLITQHGGVIRVESADHQGTTFIIELPVSRPNEAFQATSDMR
jgi:signal transduction histidine kinase